MGKTITPKLSDSEIAAALGVEAKGVAVWRNTNYLRATGWWGGVM